MKLFLVLLGVFLLAGCANPEDRAARAAQQHAEDGATCASLGAKSGDQEFQCRMALRKERNDLSERQAAHWRAASQQMLNPPVYNSPQPIHLPRQVLCTSMRTGHMTTVNCI